MADNTFRALVTVLVKGTDGLRAVQTGINNLTAPIRNVAAGIGQIGKASGITRIGHAAGEAFERVRHLGAAVTELLAPLGAIGAAGSVAGLVELTRHAAEYGASLHEGAIRTGVQVEQLAAYRYAASLAEVSADSLDKGLLKLNRTVGDAAVGKNLDALALFRHLGINIRDANGHVRSAGDLLPQLAEAFKRNEDPTLRARMAIALFGKAGADLIPLLAKGRVSLDEITREAKRLGLVLSEEDAAAAKEFQDSWIGLEGATRGLTTAIGAQLFPVLAPLVRSLTDWLVANRALIASDLREFVSGLAKALSQVDWIGIGQGIASFARGLWAVLEPIGGVNTALAGLALMLASPLLTAVYGLAKAFAFLGATILSTPIGWIAAGIVVAVGTIALSVYEIYRHWTPLKEFFRALWTEVVRLFQEAWEKIRPIVDGIKYVWNLPGRAGAAIQDTILQGLRPPQPSDAVDPTSGLPLPVPRLYAPGAAAAAGAAAGRVAGQVRVRVDLNNLPPGSQVQTDSSGVAPPETNVGYAFGGRYSSYGNW